MPAVRAHAAPPPTSLSGRSRCRASFSKAARFSAERMFRRLNLYPIRQASCLLRVFMPDYGCFEMPAENASCFGSSGVVTRRRELGLLGLSEANALRRRRELEVELA
jgi:hypothetical protein